MGVSVCRRDKCLIIDEESQWYGLSNLIFALVRPSRDESILSHACCKKKHTHTLHANPHLLLQTRLLRLFTDRSWKKLDSCRGNTTSKESRIHPMATQRQENDNSNTKNNVAQLWAHSERMLGEDRNRASLKKTRALSCRLLH